MTRMATGAEIDFVRDVAPILEKHCLLCHRSEDSESGLRLTHASDLKESNLVVPQRCRCQSPHFHRYFARRPTSGNAEDRKATHF